MKFVETFTLKHLLFSHKNDLHINKWLIFSNFVLHENENGKILSKGIQRISKCMGSKIFSRNEEEEEAGKKLEVTMTIRM